MTRARKAIFLLLYIFLLVSFINNLTGLTNSDRSLKSSTQARDRERDTNKKLLITKAKQTDPSEIEKTIRNGLPRIRENEEVYIIPFPSPTPLPEPTRIVPIYEQWIAVLFPN